MVSGGSERNIFEEEVTDNETDTGETEENMIDLWKNEKWVRGSWKVKNDKEKWVRREKIWMD